MLQVPPASDIQRPWLDPPGRWHLHDALPRLRLVGCALSEPCALSAVSLSRRAGRPLRHAGEQIALLDLSKLNPEQREAVTTTEGALLVVAGPGSGKTAVIAARAAYIIDKGLAEPSAVLAVTFTNKAGRELKRRLASVLDESAREVWAGTFHAFMLFSTKSLYPLSCS